MNWKKLAVILTIAFILYCIFTIPEDTGQAGNETAGGLGFAASQILVFIRSLFN